MGCGGGGSGFSWLQDKRDCEKERQECHAEAKRVKDICMQLGQTLGYSVLVGGTAACLAAAKLLGPGALAVCGDIGLVGGTAVGSWFIGCELDYAAKMTDCRLYYAACKIKNWF